MAAGIWNVTAPSFTDNVLVGGKKVGQVNLLIIDFIKSEFDRSLNPLQGTDPKPELAFQIANDVLGRIRVYSRAFQIRPVLIGSDSWQLAYLSDDGQLLEHDPAKKRFQTSVIATIGAAAVTPEIFQLVGPNWQKPEPYVWDQLLLDAQAQLPDIGAAIVMAYSSLETFIQWALQILNDKQPLPGGLWDWINERDHWSKEPSVTEKFDALLRVFSEQSLKDDARLWQTFADIRKARNSVAHEGVATLSGKPIDAGKAKQLVDGAHEIIAWVERLLPETHRRLRTAALGPFTRRVATPLDAARLGRSGESARSPLNEQDGSSSRDTDLEKGEKNVS